MRDAVALAGYGVSNPLTWMEIRMAVKILPPAWYLRECLDYDPDIGALTWRVRPESHFLSRAAMDKWNGRQPGKLAGTIVASVRPCKTKTLSIRIDGIRHQAHRLIWKMATGNDPVAEVDHRNRDSLDNRWDNLRPATRSQQSRNQSIRKNNTSRKKGVYWSKTNRNWVAQITIGPGNKVKNLGSFQTIEEASLAYKEAAIILFGEYWSDGEHIKC